MLLGFELPPPAAAGVYAASVRVEDTKPQGEIHPAIYGQYLEHVQRADECVYPSIWDGASPLADDLGLRVDVIEAARRLGVPVVRWPGGCFADVYHWENGIGPRARRPVLPNRHWGGTESHQFGTDEFLRWCGKVGADPYINLNLGSGSLAEALRWLEYCNGGPETPQGGRRAANGHPRPYQVRFWGIGNETWGPWETGHTNAAAYAETLAEWAAAMRAQDPKIKILGVGSNEGADPAWDRAVLERAGPLIDYLTIHLYGSSTNTSGEQYEAVVFTPDYFDFRIRQLLRTMDGLRERSGSKRPLQLALDEWNLRHYRGRQLARRDPRTMQDAVFTAGVLNVLLRHSPRVGMANHVFLVNGHAPLLVNEQAVVEAATFPVFQQYARWMRGHTVKVEITSPSAQPPRPWTGAPHPNLVGDYRSAPLPYLDGAAAIHRDGALVITLVNRHPADAARVALQLPGGYAAREVWTLGAASPRAANDFDEAGRVRPEKAIVKPTLRELRCLPFSVVMVACQPE